MIAQFLLIQITKPRKNNTGSKIINKILMILRSVYLKFNDSTLVKYKFGGISLLLPFRHDLPINLSLFPFYDSAIARIPNYLAKKYSDFQAIDIGANIGDTAAAIRSKTNIPILCIEGDSFYYKLLVDNSKMINNLELENCFVGENKSQNVQVINYKGSAWLTKHPFSDNKIILQSLTEIIDRHPAYNNVKFLKIDTDGFDGEILRSNFSFLERHKPVIYFEYDPYFLSKNADDGLSLFKSLHEAGYEKLIIYNNIGEYLLGVDISNESILKDLHLFYSGRNSEMYMDICTFHKDDNDIYRTIRELEFEFFAMTKTIPN
jgi:FkbM family methyltransferase